MSDLTSKLLSGLKPGVDQIKIYDVRIADMNDAQCRLALMWFLSNMPEKGPEAEKTEVWARRVNDIFKPNKT